MPESDWRNWHAGALKEENFRTFPQAAAIQPAKEAAAKLRRRVGRFEVYNLLPAVYRVYVNWKRRKAVKRSARALANELGIAQRKSMRPIRVLIEATLPEADFKP